MHGQVSSKKKFELAPRKIKQVSAYANEANWESEFSLQKDSNSADRPWEIEKSTNKKVLARGLGHSPKFKSIVSMATNASNLQSANQY
jgi:hypothetical protein